jgi:hypothetical protein
MPVRFPSSEICLSINAFSPVLEVEQFVVHERRFSVSCLLDLVMAWYFKLDVQ